MVPLDETSEGGLGGTSDEPFGPLAALLVGFTQTQFEKFREIMIDMEADIVKVAPPPPLAPPKTLNIIERLNAAVRRLPSQLICQICHGQVAAAAPCAARRFLGSGRREVQRRDLSG